MRIVDAVLNNFTTEGTSSKNDTQDVSHPLDELDGLVVQLASSFLKMCINCGSDSQSFYVHCGSYKLLVTTIITRVHSPSPELGLVCKCQNV